MAEPRTKRRRMSTNDAEATSEPTQPITRSTDYWFEDGTVILQVEATQFKLTKGLLALHSSVFHDMFMIPLPVDEPTIEACPVVVLSGDGVQDWVHLLSVIYPRSIQRAPRVSLVAAVLRLAKKYDIAEFRRDCLQRLKYEFAAELSDYDQNDCWSLIQDEEDNMGLVSVVSIAREIGVFTVLPSIYCVMVEDANYMEIVSDTTDTRLTTTDRLACLRGYTVLSKLQFTTTFAWLSLNGEPPFKLCAQRKICMKGINEIYGGVSGSKSALWIIGYWKDSWDKHLCSACRKKAKEVYEAGRKANWEQLPAAFGLPKWAELKSMDFE